MPAHNVIREINDAPSSAADFKAAGIKADVIAESTSATGVTIDSILLKDGDITSTSGTVTVLTVASGSVDATGRIKSSSPALGVGYATGAGGAVTQITNASTGVTLTGGKICGQITTVALTTAAAAEERFTVTNTSVDATDVIVLGTTYNGAGTPMLSVQKIVTNGFDIVITNVHSANALNAVMVINFAVIKAVAA